MLSIGNIGRDQSEIVCVEDLVPKDHLLRKKDAAVDFTKKYEKVKDLYCKDNGRPSTDQVVLFKIAIIQHLYGISSLRKTADEIGLNVEHTDGFRVIRCWKGHRISQRSATTFAIGLQNKQLSAYSIGYLVK